MLALVIANPEWVSGLLLNITAAVRQTRDAATGFVTAHALNITFAMVTAPVIVCALSPECRQAAWDLSKVIKGLGAAGVGAAAGWGIHQLQHAIDDHPEVPSTGESGAPKTMDPPGRDPTKSPGEGWEWRGDPEGSSYNPATGESMHPDLEHGPPQGPHWDYIDPEGDRWRVDPDTGVMTPN
jgi:hypothetical protein